MAEHAARRARNRTPRPRATATLAVATGALFAANLVTLTVHDTTDPPRPAQPNDHRAASGRISGGTPARQPATAHPTLIDFGGPAISRAPSGTTTLSPPVVSFKVGVPGAAGTVTPDSLQPRTEQGTVLPASESNQAPAEAPRVVAAPSTPTPPSAPTPPSESAPQILSALPMELVLPNLPGESVVPALSDLIGVGLPAPLVSASEPIPLIVQPQAASATDLVAASLGD